MLKGALLDKDGVIVNSEPLYLQAVRESFKPFVDISEEEFIRRWMIEQTTSAGVIRDYKLNVSLEEIRATREKILERLIREELELMPYAREVIERLCANYPLGVVSSAHKEESLRDLGKFELLKKFRFILSGDDCIRKKVEHTEIWERGVRQIGASAGEVLVIEDNPAAAKQAKLAGCKVIAYPNGFTRGMKFEYADVIVYSLKEVDDRLLARLF